MKSILFTICFLAAILLVFHAVDMYAGPATVQFHSAPTVMCERTQISAITLPPFGIFACTNVQEDELLRSHELVHWDQYKDRGFILFYFDYLKGMVEADFVYENHPMEIEARQLSGEESATSTPSTATTSPVQ